MLSIVINLLLALHIIVSLLIILIVLMQRPKNEGLGAAFGGGMTENLFGAQTTNVLSTITRWLGVIFFTLTLTLAILYSKQSHIKSGIQQKLINAPKPAATATPKPNAAALESPTPSPSPVVLSGDDAAPLATPAKATPKAVAPPVLSPSATAKPSPNGKKRESN